MNANKGPAGVLRARRLLVQVFPSLLFFAVARDQVYISRFLRPTFICFLSILPPSFLLPYTPARPAWGERGLPTHVCKPRTSCSLFKRPANHLRLQGPVDEEDSRAHEYPNETMPKRQPQWLHRYVAGWGGGGIRGAMTAQRPAE